MNLIAKSKIPLHWAAEMLTALCDQADNSPELDEAFFRAFHSAEMSLEESIDRRKALMWTIEGTLKAARGARAEIDAYIQILKKRQEKLKDATRLDMEANPNLPWRDSVGRKLSLAKNQASLNLTFDLKDKRTFTGLLHDETIRMFDIEEKYITRVNIALLNNATVKADLAAGVELIWAELETDKKHVRGLLPKEEEMEDDQHGS